MSNPLLQFYADSLPLFGFEADPSGDINLGLSDKLQPSAVGGRNLIMPSTKRLRLYDLESEVVFHPLSESYHQAKPTEVLDYLRSTFVLRMNLAIGSCFIAMSHLAGSYSDKQGLTPNQLELLTLLGEADADTAKNVTDFVTKTNTTKGKTEFFGLSLRKNGNYQGRRCDRLGVVFFPLYEKLAAGEEKAMRAKDRKFLQAAYEWLFDTKNKEAYNRPNHDATAPFFSALLESAVVVSSRLNDMIEVLEENNQTLQVMFARFKTDLAWYDEFDNNRRAVYNLINTIPAPGAVVNNESVQAPAVNTMVTTTTTPMPKIGQVTHTPVAAPAMDQAASVMAALGGMQVAPAAVAAPQYVSQPVQNQAPAQVMYVQTPQGMMAVQPVVQQVQQNPSGLVFVPGTGLVPAGAQMVNSSMVIASPAAVTPTASTAFPNVLGSASPQVAGSSMLADLLNRPIQTPPWSL